MAADSGYSPPLRIGLELHGRRFDVAEISPEFVRVRGAVPAAPGVATVRFELDGALTVSEVVLFDGIDPQRKRQPIRSQPTAGESVARSMSVAG
jgi:hypothetical protein